ncbi:MAG TPA: hypothetical protein VLM91_05960 [Candidatus Methylomirabilis sp.]|nr:hypothetical protein [Candidatus Methylomirabilis sp.]
MDNRELIKRTLRSLARRLRLVRACAAGVRFLVVGLALALVPLCLKGLFPTAGPVVALALAAGLAVLGFLYGLLVRLPLSRVARLADQRLHFKERLTSAEEHLRLAEPDDVVRAQLAETVAGLQGVRPRAVFPLRLPHEAGWAPPVAALTLALALLPPIPLRLPTPTDEPASQEAKVDEETRENPLEQKPAKPATPNTPFAKGREQKVQRGPLSPRDHQGDLAAVFKDTKVSEQRPDFGSFVKQGDERLKLLARPDSLPDLSRDFTQSPYQVAIRRMQEQLRSGRLQGLTWDQIERLLSEMGQSQQRLGGNGLPDDLMSELNGENGASPDKMLSALSRALDRLRDKGGDSQGKGKNLKEAPGSREGQQPGEGQGESDGREDGSAAGSLPGTERSLQTQGESTPRIATQKQDSMLEGDLREGQMEAYNTNLSGGGAQNPSRLPFMDVFSQYKKSMEETLTKEPIPFNYREQVKQYFQSLESR